MYDAEILKLVLLSETTDKCWRSSFIWSSSCCSRLRSLSVESALCRRLRARSSAHLTRPRSSVSWRRRRSSDASTAAAADDDLAAVPARPRPPRVGDSDVERRPTAPRASGERDCCLRPAFPTYQSHAVTAAYNYQLSLTDPARLSCCRQSLTITRDKLQRSSVVARRYYQLC